MRLRPYIPERDFETIKSWESDERTHALWCANRIPYPFDMNSFEAFLNKEAADYGDCPFVATTDDGKNVGFFCYSLNLDTNEGMLKFVMIDNNLRGKGYGKEMLDLVLKYAFEITKAKAVHLNVFTVNSAAIKCYTKAGFTERSVTPDVFRFHDESWGRRNMIIYKDSITNR